MRPGRRVRQVCVVLLCFGPLLVVLGRDAAVWLSSSPVENFLRWGIELDDVPADGARLLEGLRQATCSPEERLRRRSYSWLYFLMEAGQVSDEDAAPLLARGLRDPYLPARFRAMGTVQAHANPDLDFGERWRSLSLRLKYHLVAAMADSCWEIRKRAIDVLSKLGPEASFALPEIERALSDPNRAVAASAEHAIREMAKEPPTRHKGP